MTFIDLSDAEGMFGLYLEFVADERAECRADPERLSFVEGLLAQLETMEATLDQAHLSATVQKLKSLHECVDRGFADDPVMVHLNDLIDETEKLGDI